MRHWPKFPRPPPSLGTLGLTKLGHLACFETPSLPIKFGTCVYFLCFSMIINSESRIETVVLNNENCQIFDQSHQISSLHSLHNSPPPSDQWESLNYSKVHKTWVWWAKIYFIILWQGPFDPLPPTVFVPIKIWKKKLDLDLTPSHLLANFPKFSFFF